MHTTHRTKLAAAWPTIFALTIAIAVLAAASPAMSAERAAEPGLQHFETPDGVTYGLWNHVGDKPAPTLFMLAGTIEGTLERPYYRQCGNELAELGYLVVSIDLPCHGTQTTEGEPAGLSGWGQRVGNGEDIVAESNVRLSQVLDHLITIGLTDPSRVAAAGTSRGGFLAIHFAAHDPRVKAVAGFAPVTDLAALSEFRAKQEHALVRKLSLKNQAERTAPRPSLGYKYRFAGRRRIRRPICELRCSSHMTTIRRGVTRCCTQTLAKTLGDGNGLVSSPPSHPTAFTGQSHLKIR